MEDATLSDKFSSLMDQKISSGGAPRLWEGRAACCGLKKEATPEIPRQKSTIGLIAAVLASAKQGEGIENKSEIRSLSMKVDGTSLDPEILQQAEMYITWEQSQRGVATNFIKIKSGLQPEAGTWGKAKVFGSHGTQDPTIKGFG
ncbi:hypothetical protein P7K49_001479 [Saguinus oedipus]|uniref:Uncharacterized protein n=1 Tax=Saguinus oedipus TaxID=9490 RepID=A0ABQ9WEP0_SAGOE|nr:hypothetical protein P7K49_001479 [Saguinus oedipus]